MLKLLNHLELDRCPHCGVDSPNLGETHRFETRDHKASLKRIWVVYVCAGCGGAVLAASLKQDGNQEVRELYPGKRSVDDAIPGVAREYLAQALNSLSAPAGAVMLTASSVDAMLKEKGYKEGSLYSRIDKAADDSVITPDMAKWAHEVRLDANDQRHADEGAGLPTAEDAEHSIAFATALGQFMFVLPAKVKRGIDDAKGS